MTIKSKLTKSDFIAVHYILTYKALAIRILTVCFIVYFLSALITLIKVPDSPFTNLATAVVLLLLIPFQTYFRANRSFGPNNRLCENLEYSFEAESFSIKGESFNSQLSWSKTYQVTQTKKWILIWQNKSVANPIPKRDFTSEQINQLRNILDKQLVKNNF